MPPLTPKALAPLAACLLIAAAPFWFAAAGLHAFFTDDDLMNLYAAWLKPWSQLFLANLEYWSPSYRPLGALCYRISYALFGFNPLPLRLLCYALILLNSYLLCRAAAALTGSRAAGLLAALLASFHGKFEDLYYNSGTLYDLLCFAFYFAAFGHYVQARQAGRPVRWWLVVPFFLCALNSKEMAITLPLAICTYEAIYHRRLSRGACLMALLGVPYVLGKLSHASAFAGNAEYRHTVTLGMYLDHYASYAGMLFYQRPDWMTKSLLLTLFAVMFAVAWRLRRPALWLSLAFILFSVLPVVFIPLRGLFVLYIPLAGWAIYTATLIDAFSPRPAPAFALTALCLFALHTAHTPAHKPDTEIADLTQRIRKDYPTLPPGPFRHPANPFPPDSWNFMYIVRLSYGDPNIEVDRSR